MKTNWMIAIGIVLLLGCAATAYAQSRTVEMQIPMTTSVTGQVKVYIDFPFTVGDSEFKAGDYFITPMNEKTIAIRSVSKEGRSAVVMTNGVTRLGESSGPKLVFHRYGARTFLAQFWGNYSESGREMFASSEEVKLARIYTQQQVTLIAATK